jgi:hypothetical protein
MGRYSKRIQRIQRRYKPRKNTNDGPESYDDVYSPDWAPKSAAQKAALNSRADILLFGGTAGSLKTETLLVDAARECKNPNLRAIIFRQQRTQMSDIVEKTQRLYIPLGATFTGNPFWTWTFPSGGTIRLGYISSDDGIFQYLGPRYSFIGFDESTFHTEHQVRNMLGRLSSTDNRLRLRMRLASNPGNTGAAWHKAMFLRGTCPVHNAQGCAQPGVLYWDARWPSDQYPLQDPDGSGFSVSFIPGRLSDHTLLDPKYLYRLRMMSGSLAKAMELGCWCAVEGAYFGNWNPSKMIIPYGRIEAQWWDSHFVSLDYGFGQSSAAALLHVRTQDGKIKTIAEFVASNLPAYDFAREVIRRFVDQQTQGQRRKIVATYLDPSNFKNIGDGHTIADQINEVFEPYELGCVPASNDRIGGWQLMYELLQRGEWLIADTCPQLIRSLPTRLHDRKRLGDLRKIPGDPLDDVADSARYGIYSFINRSEPPNDPIDYEQLQFMAKNGDLTSAAIRYQLMTAKATSLPATIGRYAAAKYRDWRYRASW